MRTYLTIYTDISFKQDKDAHTIGYAIWAKCKGVSEVLTGTHRLDEIRWTPNLAEAWTICKGISYMCKEFPMGYNTVFVKTDNKNAVRLLGMGYKQWGLNHFTSEKQQKLIDFMKNRRKQLPIYVKHVRGHEGGKTKQSWVNEWCDTNAKEALNQYLNDVK